MKTYKDTYTHNSHTTHTHTHIHPRTDTKKQTHTHTATHAHSHTNKERHTRTQTHTHKDTDRLTHTHTETETRENRNFAYLSFWRSNLISCERVATIPWKSWRSNLISCERVATIPWKPQVYLSFWRSKVVSCERDAADPWKSQFTAVLDDRTSFRAKGLRPQFQNRNLLQFLTIHPHRVATGTRKSKFNRSFWRSTIISCEMVAIDASLDGTAPALGEKKN